MTVTYLAVGAALLAPLLSYLGVVRKLSGKVKTTDASQLWQAAKEMREELAARNEALNRKVDQCNQRIDRLETNADRLDEINDELRSKNKALEDLVRAHEATITHLTAENEALTRRVAELEAANGT
jgi:DNA repair ATPase RecN